MKKIATSLILIALVSSVAVGATRAYFSDTETSEGNTFSAGTLDLTVDGQDDPNVVHVALANMKPGDGVGGAEHSTIQYMWTLCNTGSLPGQPWIEINNLKDLDNGCGEPEATVPDVTCGGDPEGELSANLFMQINAAGSGGFEYPHGGTCVDSGRNCPVNYWESHGPVGQGTWETIPAGECIAAMVLELEIPTTVGNIIQSDSTEFDIVFHLDQITP